MNASFIGTILFFCVAANAQTVSVTNAVLHTELQTNVVMRQIVEPRIEQTLILCPSCPPSDPLVYWQQTTTISKATTVLVQKQLYTLTSEVVSLRVTNFTPSFSANGSVAVTRTAVNSIYVPAQAFQFQSLDSIRLTK